MTKRRCCVPLRAPTSSPPSPNLHNQNTLLNCWTFSGLRVGAGEHIMHSNAVSASCSRPFLGRGFVTAVYHGRSMAPTITHPDEYRNFDVAVPSRPSKDCGTAIAALTWCRCSRGRCSSKWSFAGRVAAVRSGGARSPPQGWQKPFPINFHARGKEGCRVVVCCRNRRY